MSDLAALADAVRLAGVVGAGGAGFPTHLKFARRAEIVVINGAECEPLLRVDQELLARCTDELLAGIDAVREAAAPGAIWLGVKAKHEAIVDRWRRFEGRGFKVRPLDDYYPAGDEHILVHEVTGRTVPAGGIPPDVGVTVINVETLLNVGRAVRGRPVTGKFVTVNGLVARPATLEVPVGTPLAALVAMAGGLTAREAVLLEGGPMMGKVVGDPGAVVTRTTKALLAVPSWLDLVHRRQADWRVVARRSSSNCEICQRCTDLCPRYLLGHNLEPHKVMRAYAYGGNAPPTASLAGALYCVECGVCELFACPTGVFPRQVTGSVKEQLLAAGRRPQVDRENGPKPRQYAGDRRVPFKRLVARLGLAPYDLPAPLSETRWPERTLTVRVPLKPPFGATCRPVVAAGQLVRAGDVVGEIPDRTLGARAHASIDGRVEAVDERYVVITGPAPGPAGGEA
jgi:Na+-translocating ferredoxin:NAD+ oxidoreductase RnfC subunit